MVRTPGEKPIPNKNRSAKHLFGLTRAGLRQMWEWQRQKGIPEYKPKKEKKRNKVDENKSADPNVEVK